MKKTYVKPEIMFESFVSSVNIAGDCEIKTNTPNSRTCGIEWGDEGDILFLAISGTKCKGLGGLIKPNYGPDDGYLPASPGLYDQICYHVPYDGQNNLFNS